jgi:uncharacterized protein (DUF433 family)
MMALPFATEPVESIPLTVNADDVVCVGDTRVTLHTVLEAFRDGATPEEIASQYPALDLADVYAVLGYCLRHSAQIEDYLTARRESAARVKQETEVLFPPQGVRARLLARRARPTTED